MFKIFLLFDIVLFFPSFKEGMFLLKKFCFSKFKKNFEGFSQLSTKFARDLTIQPLIFLYLRFSNSRLRALRESFKVLLLIPESMTLLSVSISLMSFLSDSVSFFFKFFESFMVCPLS